jgi:hypothetical protein
MVQKTPGRKVYRTANGKSIDLDQLIQRNELTPAVGNARVNARGDELGPGGQIVRKREDVLRDYYQNSVGVPDESATAAVEPARRTETKANSPAVVQKTRTTSKNKTANIDLDTDWQEDEHGNFIKKGSR